MTPDDMKEIRRALGLSQLDFATALGKTRGAVARYEKGDLAISKEVAGQVAKMSGKPAPADPAPAPIAAPAPAPKAEKVKAPKAKAAPVVADSRAPSIYDFESAPTFTRGLERLPTTNVDGCRWADMRTCEEGWQRVPGCIRVVHGSIPAPIPFVAPQWAGWRGQLTASGAVYDALTGAPMQGQGRTRQASDFKPAHVARPKAEKKARR